jgi:hypothetical protein
MAKTCTGRSSRSRHRNRCRRERGSCRPAPSAEGRMGESATELSELQRSRFAAAFGEVDEALFEAARALDVDALRSSFSTRIADVTPIQHRLISDYAERMRAAMETIARRHAVAPPRPRCSALQTVRFALDRATVAVEELGPGPMPFFDGAPYVGRTVLRQAPLAFLGRRWRCRAARRWLVRSRVRASLTSALHQYFERVNEWRLDALAELGAGLAARSRSLRALCPGPAAGPIEPNHELQALRADLEALQRVESRAATAGNSIDGQQDTVAHVAGVPERSECNG